MGNPADPQEWLKRAASNLARAETAPASSEILLEDLCFDAQQAAEKALKAILVGRGAHFPKTHNIGELLTRVERAGVAIPETVKEAHQLTTYAVTGRYPGLVEDVAVEEWNRAVACARAVVVWARATIGSKPT